MKQIVIRGSLLAILALGVNHQALAHVGYTDFSGLAGGTETAYTFTNYGWNQGQVQLSANAPQGAKATTDDVGWYGFTLTEASDITLKFTNAGIVAGDAPLTALGFSLYSGQLWNNAYDITKLPDYSTAPGDGQRGLVNTAASFGMTTEGNIANATAHIRNLTFLTSASDGGTGTASLVNYLLGPGTYSVIAGGNSLFTDLEDANAAWAGKISYSAVAPSAVPVPAAFWLMGSALAGFRFFGQRKNRLAA